MTRRIRSLPLFTLLLLSLPAFPARDGQWYRHTDSLPGDAFSLPLDIPPLLSANFGELRANHFHSGLDFKTQGTIGKTVRAVAPGWVSRIGIHPTGYGKALYIDHPNGYTSVYGHLDRLAPTLDSLLLEAQYRSLSYEQELHFAEGEVPVEQGQVVAYSGNTGSSGGPHLHFELRHTQTEEPVNPLRWFRPYLTDRRPPQIQAIVVYTLPGEGWVENAVQETEGDYYRLILPAHPTEPVKAWGKIGIGLKAYDYMDGTSNVYGVHRFSLKAGAQDLFRVELCRFSFDESPEINGFCDYYLWARQGSWFMKAFCEQDIPLDVYPVRRNEGWIYLSSDTLCLLTIEAADAHGNLSRTGLPLQGTHHAFFPLPDDRPEILPSADSRIEEDNFTIDIPKGALYRPLPIDYDTLPAAKGAYSLRFRLFDEGFPLRRPVQAEFHLLCDPDLSEGRCPDKPYFYLARYNEKKDRWDYQSSEYHPGKMTARLKQWGTYTVLADTVGPKIIFPSLENALKNDLIRIVIRDDQSGIAGYSALIDGRWALLEDDYKQESVLYRFDGIALKKTGGSHRMLVSVWDRCGNMSQKEWIFTY